MSKNDKLIARLLTLPIPKDFRWIDLVKVLGSCGYKRRPNSATGGSRRSFVHKQDGHIISLHEPHPSGIVKPTALSKVVEVLKERGLI